jgi:biotin carboxyl carrier protein
MKVEEIERLVGLVEHAHISELTLRQEGARLTIRKPVGVAHTHGALVPYEEPHEFAEEEGYIETPLLAAPSEPIATVTAPLVGFFRHVKPMVGLGAQVKQGQIIGIIEAMKLVNEVKAPEAGVVTDVLVEDGLPVEYGQALFDIRIAERGDSAE